MTDQEWLEHYIQKLNGVAGTVHRREPGGLRLTASRNIPPKVCEIVAWVPDGKGMAGQALVTAKPVTTCNLKDDPSAAVRPGARAVDAQAAVALPVLSAEGAVIGVVGVAWPDSRDFSQADIDGFASLAASLPATPTA
jgi:L-methionine (R)-S-oxide reductase